MKKLLAVLSIFALAFTGITQVSALSQSEALTQAERFIRGFGYTSYTQNDIDLQANAFYFAFSRGRQGLTYDAANEYVIDLIIPAATQDMINHEIDVLQNYYIQGALENQRLQVTNVQPALNTIEIQTLVSQAGFTAYAAGFADGQNSNTGSSVNALASFVPQLLGVGFGFFLQIASFEVLGVSLLSVLAMMVGLTGLLITLKVATGGR
jgi:hypothetical protein